VPVLVLAGVELDEHALVMAPAIANEAMTPRMSILFMQTFLSFEAMGGLAPDY
jgi:hypothetical protein